MTDIHQVDPADLLARREYLLDLSLLPLLPRFLPDSGIVLLVPASLHLLLRAPATPHRNDLLTTVLRLTGRRCSASLPERENTNDLPDSEPQVGLGECASAESIVDSYGRLFEQGAVRTIPDEDASPEVRVALKGLVRSSKRAVVLRLVDQTLSASTVVMRHVITILEYSRRTGAAILMRGRSLVARLAGRLATLELPSRADHLVHAKSQFLQRAFPFPGGRALRFFVGVTIDVVGSMQHPILGIAGIVLTIIDP